MNLESVAARRRRAGGETGLYTHPVTPGPPFPCAHVGEFVPTSGTGEAIGAGLIKFVEEKKGINMDEVRILGGDSCAANVGKFGGALTCIERMKKQNF